MSVTKPKRIPFQQHPLSRSMPGTPPPRTPRALPLDLRAFTPNTHRVVTSLRVLGLLAGATGIILLGGALAAIPCTANAQGFWHGLNQGLHMHYGIPYQAPQRRQAAPLPPPTPLSLEPQRAQHFQAYPDVPSRTLIPSNPNHRVPRGMVPVPRETNPFTGITYLPGKSQEDEY